MFSTRSLCRLAARIPVSFPRVFSLVSFSLHHKISQVCFYLRSERKKNTRCSQDGTRSLAACSRKAPPPCVDSPRRSHSPPSCAAVRLEKGRSPKAGLTLRLPLRSERECCELDKKAFCRKRYSIVYILCIYAAQNNKLLRSKASSTHLPTRCWCPAYNRRVLLYFSSTGRVIRRRHPQPDVGRLLRRG